MVFLGDSITAQPGYVAMVAEARPDLLVVNAGCGLTTSFQWQRFDARPPGLSCAVLGDPPSLYDRFVAPFLPARVYVLLGTNDARFHAAHDFLGVPVPPSDYGDYVLAIADRLLDDGATQVHLVAPPAILDATPEEAARLAAYREELESLCAFVPDVFCGPDLSILLEPSDFADNLHPNAQGHAKIAEAILAELP